MSVLLRRDEALDGSSWGSPDRRRACDRSVADRWATVEVPNMRSIPKRPRILRHRNKSDRHSDSEPRMQRPDTQTLRLSCLGGRVAE